MSQILRHKTKPECGTRSGYDYHRRVLYQEPCFKCEKAERTYHRERRAANREKVNAMRRINRINNPAITIRTRYTKEQITELYGTDCYLCLRPIDFEAPSKVGLEGWELSYHPDHVIPLSKGGLDVIENLRPTHGQCNIRKAATVLEETR
jgi:5-methylcytosine-specific restriction endonuclease McrA